VSISPCALQSAAALLSRGNTLPAYAKPQHAGGHAYDRHAAPIAHEGASHPLVEPLDPTCLVHTPGTLPSVARLCCADTAIAPMNMYTIHRQSAALLVPALSNPPAHTSRRLAAPAHHYAAGRAAPG
jgi:hypothetical protein